MSKPSCVFSLFTMIILLLHNTFKEKRGDSSTVTSRFVFSLLSSFLFPLSAYLIIYFESAQAPVSRGGAERERERWRETRVVSVGMVSVNPDVELELLSPEIMT